MKEAVFTVTEGIKGISIKSKSYSQYNRCEIDRKDLYQAMCELTDIFNNVLGIGILFDVE